MWIEKFITRRVITVGPRESIIAAGNLMAAHHIRHLPVVDAENRLMGIISDRDVRSASPPQVDDASTRAAAPMVAEVMTVSPVTISPKVTLQDALLQFQMKKVGAFPVTDDDGRVIGILSDRDLLNCFIRVMGIGSPGSFVGLEVDTDDERVKSVVEVLTGGGFPIASMLVIRDWRPQGWAIFLYVLTQNRSALRRRLTDYGFSMISPMDWLLTRLESRAA